jgi:hypothetical protein
LRPAVKRDNLKLIAGLYEPELLTIRRKERVPRAIGFWNRGRVQLVP